ncbi:fimbrial protein [Rahnella laticis]|uniref:fimbrial protein n=1 Tax=Rahnella laticis TaxID=2787622 RepID=UPI0018A26F53|nr:type 1 fimbrial protein [Rahnella laticis]MBF7993697.1 type 1 fimbrial protein [Rahnella laticis]
MTVAVITASLLSVSAMNANANSGTIKFSGAISAATCDFNVAVNGVVSPTGVVDLGVFNAESVNDLLTATPGAFGTPVNLSLVPDVATCADGITPEGLGAMVKIDAAQVDATNTDVVTSAETATTNAGVEFKLASGDSIVNAGAVTLSKTGDLDATTGAINFTAQPYAVTGIVAAGIIGGAVSYTVAYL